MIGQLPPGTEKIRLEDIRGEITEQELDVVNTTYYDFIKWRAMREGSIKQFQGNPAEVYWRKSRELFWNTKSTDSEDLRELGLEFSIPFVRKEVMDFLSKISSQNYKPRLNGEGLDVYGVKVLQGMLDKWRFHSNDKVEKFFDLTYGQINGTLCKFVGYNDSKLTYRYLTSYKDENNFTIKEKDTPYWDDVWTEICPIEDIYLPKIWERNIQKQGRMIWKTEMDWKDFKAEFKSFDNAEYVYPGNQFAENSLYYTLLQGAGVTASDRVQVLKRWDIFKDEYITIANGVWLNPIGKGKKQQRAPNPFDHKMLPFTWSLAEVIDEKFAYGLALPFKIKDLHKLRNMQLTMLMEREFRMIDPPILSSDFEAPKLVYGQHKVIPVNDINAYKELALSDASPEFMNTMNILEGFSSSLAQGGQGMGTGSAQPRSAREVMQLQALQQQALGNALTMYYDLIRQETILMLKTALQFYPLKKYQKQKENILRALTLPNYPLIQGGSGTLEIRFTKAKSNDFALWLESINRGSVNGSKYEIIEAPLDLIEHLEFEITTIDIEPEQSSDIKKQTFFEQVIQPMLQIYVQMGIADPGKVFLRHMEMMGEHPADYVSTANLPTLMKSWSDAVNVKITAPPTKAGQSTTGIINGPQGGPNPAPGGPGAAATPQFNGPAPIAR
jgi:hypothetical protein